MQIVLKVSHHHRQPRLIRLAQYVKSDLRVCMGPIMQYEIGISGPKRERRMHASHEEDHRQAHVPAESDIQAPQLGTIAIIEQVRW